MLNTCRGCSGSSRSTILGPGPRRNSRFVMGLSGCLVFVEIRELRIDFRAKFVELGIVANRPGGYPRTASRDPLPLSLFQQALSLFIQLDQRLALGHACSGLHHNRLDPGVYLVGWGWQLLAPAGDVDAVTVGLWDQLR